MTPGRTLILIGAAAWALVGQDVASQDPARLKQRFAEVQARLAQVDGQLASLKKRRKGVLVELQDISLQAERIRVQADGARLQRDQTQSEVQLIGAQKEAIHKEIRQLRVEIRKQVRWMQTMGPLGGVNAVPDAGSFDDFLARGRYLAYWQTRQQRKLDRVQRLQGDLQQREEALQLALKRLQKEEEEAHRYQASLRLGEARLQTFLEDLRQDESRQKDVQAELAEESLQLERLLAGLMGKPKAELFDPSQAFASLRGELPRPAEGTLAQGFGEHLHPKFKTKTVQSGLLIAGESGAPVQAVAEGRVVFAESYQSYGPMVILDHGGGYFSLYTHLQRLQVAKGQVLRAGEMVGALGDTVEGPRLGFEIRHQAAPQDPQKWLKQKFR